MALLLAVAGGVMYFLWNRRSDKSSWRQSLGDTTMVVAPDDEPRAAPRPQQPPAASVVVQPQAPSPLSEPGLSVASQAAPKPIAPNSVAPLPDLPDIAGVDVDLMDMDPAAFNRLLSQRVTESGSLLTTNPPELIRKHFNHVSSLDAIQQAEFFMKLGKTDQALEVLETKIRSNPSDCPFVYLEILRIANANSLKTDFRQFREEFEKVFNARIPEFALFRDEGRDLEAYASLLLHITAIWPTANVLDVIEACVLRDPELMNAEPFDLAAFRDLVTLHGIVYAQYFEDSPDDSSDSQHVHLDF